MNVKCKNEEKVIMQANCLFATRHNGAALNGCSVRNKMLVERNNCPSPNCTTPYGVECGEGNALFYQYLNPDGFGAKHGEQTNEKIGKLIKCCHCVTQVPFRGFRGKLPF